MPIDPETAEPVEVEAPNEVCVQLNASSPAGHERSCASMRVSSVTVCVCAWRSVCVCVHMQYECEDILGDAALFDALGVGMRQAEMTNVALAVKKLGEDPHKNVETVSDGVRGREGLGECQPANEPASQLSCSQPTGQPARRHRVWH